MQERPRVGDFGAYQVADSSWELSRSLGVILESFRNGGRKWLGVVLDKTLLNITGIPARCIPTDISSCYFFLYDALTQLSP